MKTEMEELKEGRLEIKVSEEPGKMVLTWVGHSDAPDPFHILTPYLAELGENFKGGEIIMDFSKLSYMNSSTISPIIHFLNKADTKNIKTTLQYNGGSFWQNASFRALKTMSGVMKNISIVKK